MKEIPDDIYNLIVEELQNSIKLKKIIYNKNFYYILTKRFFMYQLFLHLNSEEDAKYIPHLINDIINNFLNRYVDINTGIAYRI